MFNKISFLILNVFVFFSINTTKVFAASNNFKDFLDAIKGWMGQIAELLFAAATMAFFWGIVKYIYQDKKDEGKTLIIWSLWALFIMFSVWAIVKFLQTNTVGEVNKIDDVYIP